MTTSDLPKISRSRNPLGAPFIALLIGLVAALGAFAITAPPGPGLDPDAASYLGAAESLAAGRGYQVPVADWRAEDSTSSLTHFPPGYSTALALPIALGATPRQAARLVDAAAAFVTFTLVGWLVIGAAGLLTGICVAAAILVMHAIAIVHLSVLSEPLYLACMLGALLAMVRMTVLPDEHARSVAAGAAGVASAAAFLVRYVGASVCGAVLLWIWLRPAPRRVKARQTIIAATPWILLIGIWIVHVHRTSGVHAIRSVGPYGGLLESLGAGLFTLVAWLIPLTADQTLPGRPWLAIALLIILAVITTRGARLASRLPAGSTINAAGLLAGCYVAILVLSRWLADPGIPFDERLLAPVFVLLAIIVGVATGIWWRAARVPLRILSAAVLLAWFSASLYASQDEIAYALEFGSDFGQAQWTASPLVAWARANARHQPLYTNWPSAIYFDSHRPAHDLPNDEDGPAVLRAFADTVRARHGIVLVFDHPSPDNIGADALARVPGLRQVARVADGTVFAAATP